MNVKKKKYTNEPIGKIKIVKDFLPSPDELVLKENTVKVTLLLSKDSINYFKQEADKHHARYQTMIRALLDRYTQHYKKETSKYGVSTGKQRYESEKGV